MPRPGALQYTRKMNILIKNRLANTSTGNYSKIWGVILLGGLLNESSIYFVYWVRALRQWHRTIIFLNGYFLTPRKLWMYPKKNVHVPVLRGSVFRSQQKCSLILPTYIFSDFSMTDTWQIHRKMIYINLHNLKIIFLSWNFTTSGLGKCFLDFYVLFFFPNNEY